MLFAVLSGKAAGGRSGGGASPPGGCFRGLIGGTVPPGSAIKVALTGRVDSPILSPQTGRTRVARRIARGDGMFGPPPTQRRGKGPQGRGPGASPVSPCRSPTEHDTLDVPGASR